MNPFTIATYNVNSIRSRLHILLPWLETHRPDVFCMQETKVDDGRFPADAFTNLGYHCIFRGAKQYNGVAIASLAEPEAVRSGFSDGGAPDDDRLLCGIFDGVAVVNAYVPQGRDRESEHFAYKLAWFQRLKTFLAAHYSPAQPLVCCGDLNCAREAIDVHDPKRLRGHVCFTPEVWDAFDALTAWGWWTSSAPPEQANSTPSSITGFPARWNGTDGGSTTCCYRATGGASWAAGSIWNRAERKASDHTI